MERIIRFEKMLTDEGALILKFWFHLSGDEQKKRLKSLEKDSATRWRVTDRDWANFKLYDKFRKVSEHALRQTSTSEAPWTIVEGADPRYRYLTVGKAVLQAMRQRLATPSGEEPLPPVPPMLPSIDDLLLIRTLDLDKKISKKKYETELEEYQRKLALLTRHENFEQNFGRTVFEGNDAAGKGGSIRRITGALDARQYHIIPVAAPTEEERAQPYLWRFWRHLPRGRIRHFRPLLVRPGAGGTDRGVLLAIGLDAGLQRNQRFRGAAGQAQDRDRQVLAAHQQGGAAARVSGAGEDRLQTLQDHRGGLAQPGQVGGVRMAVCDMIDRTSTEIAPWTLVEANDKYYARIKVLKTLCKAIERAL